MAIRNTNLGGTDWALGEKPIGSTDMNNTITATQTRIYNSAVGLKRCLNVTTYSDANDITLYLSRTVLVAYDATDGKIYKSTDSGANWTEKTDSALSGAAHSYVNSRDPNYIIIWQSGSAQVIHSHDAGETWTAVTLPAGIGSAANEQYWSITDTGRIYVIFNESDNTDCLIQYTDNNGTSYTSVTGFTDIGSATGITDCKIITPKNDIIIEAMFDTSTDDAATAYTLDGGSNWVEMTGNNVCSSIGTYAIYIDANNYILDGKFIESDVRKGVHIIKWKGTTISSSATVSFLETGDSGSGTLGSHAIKTVLCFDASDFIYTFYKDNGSPNNWSIYTVRYDSNGLLYYLANIYPGATYSGVSLTAGQRRLGDGNWDIWQL